MLIDPQPETTTTKTTTTTDTDNNNTIQDGTAMLEGTEGTPSDSNTTTTTTTTTTSGTGTNGTGKKNTKAKESPTRMLRPSDPPEPPTRHELVIPPALLAKIEAWEPGMPIPDMTFMLNVWKDTRVQGPNGMGYVFYVIRDGVITICPMVAFTLNKGRSQADGKKHLIYTSKGKQMDEFKDETTPPLKAMADIGFPLVIPIWKVPNFAMRKPMVDMAHQSTEKFNLENIRKMFSEYEPPRTDRPNDPLARMIHPRNDSRTLVAREPTFTEWEQSLLDKLEPDAEVVTSAEECDGFMNDINNLVNPVEGSLLPPVTGPMKKKLESFVGGWYAIKMNYMKLDTDTRQRVGAPASALAKKAEKSARSAKERNDMKGRK